MPRSPLRARVLPTVLVALAVALPLLPRHPLTAQQSGAATEKTATKKTTTATKRTRGRTSTTAKSAKSATSTKAKTTKRSAKPAGASQGAKGGSGLRNGAGDTTKKRVPTGALGRAAGDRHLAFRGMGSDLDSLWPPRMPAPLPGSLLPAKRIVAFYGNPLSRRMGILGEFDPPEMLKRLDAEVAEWNRLDPEHPVQPALHLISVVAQASAGGDGKYRARMDSTMIEKVYGWAQSRNAILFLDVQVGLSTLQAELPLLEKFLKRPDVHLGIDPEFSMKNGGRPGKKIGTYDASDINYASRFLAGLVDKYQLPPKLLIVHRFTQKGVTNARDIRLDPRVQVVMHMDGFGAPWLKRDSFYAYVKKEPVQFAGWKQFTKLRNDSPPTSKQEILRLWPAPLYIQYQ